MAEDVAKGMDGWARKPLGISFAQGRQDRLDRGSITFVACARADIVAAGQEVGDEYRYFGK